MKAVVSVAACCCLLITLYSSLVPLVLPLATEEPSTTSSVSLPTAHTVTAFSLAKRLAMEHEMKRTCPHAKPLPEDPDSHEVDANRINSFISFINFGTSKEIILIFRFGIVSGILLYFLRFGTPG